MKKYGFAQPRQKLWLCQNSYINKIASAIHLTDFRLVYTPLHEAAVNRAIDWRSTNYLAYLHRLLIH